MLYMDIKMIDGLGTAFGWTKAAAPARPGIQRVRSGIVAKKATILDVAKAADVSTATVSRVLNNPQSVRKITRLRVQKAFADTGYSAGRLTEEGSAARQEYVSPRGSRMILTLVPDLRNPFYNDVLDGIRSSAGYDGYDTVLYQVKKSKYTVEQLRKLVDDLNVCGVLLLGKVASAKDLKLLNEYVPVVQCAEFDDGCDLPYVSIDDYAAGKTAMKLLIQGGHRRIALSNGPLSFKYAVERERAYRDALREAGLPVDEQLIVHQPDIEFGLAMANMTRLITVEDHPDAVFAVSDVMAIAAINAVRRVGLRVPEDVAVIGFDGTYISNLCDPPLTVIRQRGSQLGAYACQMLLDLIQDIPVSNRHILVDVDLVVRGST